MPARSQQAKTKTLLLIYTSQDLHSFEQRRRAAPGHYCSRPCLLKPSMSSETASNQGQVQDRKAGNPTPDARPCAEDSCAPSKTDLVNQAHELIAAQFARQPENMVLQMLRPQAFVCGSILHHLTSRLEKCNAPALGHPRSAHNGHIPFCPTLKVPAILPLPTAPTELDSGHQKAPDVIQTKPSGPRSGGENDGQQALTKDDKKAHKPCSAPLCTSRSQRPSQIHARQMTWLLFFGGLSRK
ncbi:hypothetical protein DL89DRAFT_180089 [Linderina pennispora]|uniref:Uncharacterized protein n=1 Tax=Linderina pennispora TaxID=61395 RepID=A0A1Y1W5B0_9FUNG|nr:uncharacterized protein DL89DRAFT_180089 [Linderina pennispora]ORX68572.1 hypothetical protein DL89DRAFT_180089 [Linderina pennispora]